MGTLRMLADMSSSDNSFLSLNSFPCVSSSPLFCQSPAFILKYFRNFASLFYVRYLVVKTQSNLAVEFKTQFSIFFISITYASLQLSKLYSQYIIHQKTTSTEDIFLVLVLFSLEVRFPSTQWFLNGNFSTAFQYQPLSKSLSVPLTNININHKTQSFNKKL